MTSYGHAWLLWAWLGIYVVGDAWLSPRWNAWWCLAAWLFAGVTLVCSRYELRARAKGKS